jgi:hypothetical protein
LPERILHSDACLRQNSMWPIGTEVLAPIAIVSDTASADAFPIGVAAAIKLPEFRHARLPAVHNAHSPCPVTLCFTL